MMIKKDKLFVIIAKHTSSKVDVAKINILVYYFGVREKCG